MKIFTFVAEDPQSDTGVTTVKIVAETLMYCLTLIEALKTDKGRRDLHFRCIKSKTLDYGVLEEDIDTLGRGR